MKNIKQQFQEALAKEIKSEVEAKRRELARQFGVPIEKVQLVELSGTVMSFDVKE